MANLPPRPESPLRIREDRHFSVDDRERRPAQPMASRLRGDRYAGERVYVPRPRSDTYIAPGFEPRREMEGCRAEYDDWDRDRHRSFDRDRDRRNWGHGRDGRRWELGPDRDRRPYERDRGSNRPPPLSPQRRPGSRRLSRSPPRRRPSSPSVPYRSRPRSQSRTPPSKRFRLGNYSRVTSSRSPSPHRRRSSHGRSRSRSQVHLENEVHNSKFNFRAATPDAIKVERRDPVLNSEPPMVEDHKKLLQLNVAKIDVKAPPPDALTLNQLIKSPKPSPLQDDIKPEVRMASPVLQTFEALQLHDRRMFEKFDSTNHKPSPQSPMPIQSQRSPSPSRAPKNVHESATRVLPTGPQRNWPSRSPPRGPRSHPRQPMPPSSGLLHSSAPRGPRRGFPLTGPSPSFSSPTSIASRHNPESKKNTKHLDPDLDIYRAQANRSHLAFDYLQRAKSLRRALHELDLATIDLRAAEIRHHIADVQLEKAKNGALGIDAPSATVT